MSEVGVVPLVLVVDDYTDNREMISELLVGVGLRVVEARDGVEALERAAALRPALILLDVALPRVDGWEVARRLRADPSLPAVRILAVTGNTQVDVQACARAAGCDGMMTKPFGPEALLATVNAWVGSARLAPAEP